MFNPWLTLSFKAVQMGTEAQSVVAFRMLHFASGGARSEATRMVAEKVCRRPQAVAAAAAMSGRQPHLVAGKALNAYKKRLRANKRRLSRR